MKICFVTSELLGLSKNGGIGTATTDLALEAAQAGHAVEIIYIQYSQPQLQWVDTKWRDLYQSKGIVVTSLSELSWHVRPWVATVPMRIYEHLKGSRFDKIIFSDHSGLGWACFRAKSFGLEFGETELSQILHSSSLWCNESNADFSTFYRDDCLQEYQIYQLERESYCLADVNVSPSEYMAKWTEARWGKGQQKTLCMPFVFGARVTTGELPSLETREKLDEVVFFGRLEVRKGIETFIKVLNQASLRGLCKDLTITFLGRKSTHDPEKIAQSLRPELIESCREIKYLTDFGQEDALNYLKAGHRMAVIPSPVDNSPCVVYECFREGIPFLASKGGGIPELFHAEDREEHLFEPTEEGLKKCLFPLLEDRLVCHIARPSPALNNARTAWLEFFNAPPVVARKLETADPSPLVSLIITLSHDADYLGQLFRNLEKQDYPNFEVILVDHLGACAEVLSRAQGRVPSAAKYKVVAAESDHFGAMQNHGVTQSKGKYVVFLHGETLLSPDALRKMARAMEYSDYDIITSTYLEHVRLDLPPGEKPPHGLQALLIGPVELGVIHNIFGKAMGIYRRSLFDRMQFHQLRGVTNEDWEFHLRAKLTGMKTGTIPESLFWLRSGHDEGTSATRYKNMQVVLQAYREILPPTLQKIPHLLNALHNENQSLRRQVASLKEAGLKETGVKEAARPSVPSAHPTRTGLFKHFFKYREKNGG